MHIRVWLRTYPRKNNDIWKFTRPIFLHDDEWQGNHSVKSWPPYLYRCTKQTFNQRFSKFNKLKFIKHYENFQRIHKEIAHFQKNTNFTLTKIHKHHIAKRSKFFPSTSHTYRDASTYYFWNISVTSVAVRTTWLTSANMAERLRFATNFIPLTINRFDAY